MTNLAAVIQDTVNGDIDQMPLIVLARHSDLLSAVEKLPRRIISRPALTRGLTTRRSGFCAAGDVQRWASFVRRGYVSPMSDNGVCPIAIDYDAGDEDLIVEIINRLNEIGDMIDGEIDADEREDMLKILGRRRKILPPARQF